MNITYIHIIEDISQLTVLNWRWRTAVSFYKFIMDRSKIRLRKFARSDRDRDLVKVRKCEKCPGENWCTKLQNKSLVKCLM